MECTDDEILIYKYKFGIIGPWWFVLVFMPFVIFTTWAIMLWKETHEYYSREDLIFNIVLAILSLSFLLIILASVKEHLANYSRKPVIKINAVGIECTGHDRTSWDKIERIKLFRESVDGEFYTTHMTLLLKYEEPIVFSLNNVEIAHDLASFKITMSKYFTAIEVQTNY